MTLDDVTEKARSGACIAKMAGYVAGRQERKSAKGNRFAFVQLSDTTGGFEVTMFSDTLELARDHLDTGNKVVITVEATMESDQLKLLARSVTPIDTMVADAGSAGLKVFIEDSEAIGPVASVLQNAADTIKQGGKGPIIFCLMNPDLPGEVEVQLAQDYPVTPQIKGAIKSLGGVLTVEEV